jgi:hypothetical protein
VLDGDELVAERTHLVERGIEDARETRGRLRLRAARDGRELPEPGFRLGAQRARAVSRAVDERARQLLVEQRDRQMIGRQLGVAGPPCQLLGAATASWLLSVSF